MALYLCRYRQHPQHKTLDPQARQEKFDRLWRNMVKTYPPEQHIQAWYSLPGESAGVLLIEAASPEELGAIVGPWNEVSDWEVKQVVAVDPRETTRGVEARAGG